MDRDRAFLSFWTRKEALLKAAGVGLAVDPREIEMSAPGVPARVLHVPAEFGLASDWSVSDVELPGFAAAVAVKGPPPRLQVIGDGSVASHKILIRR